MSVPNVVGLTEAEARVRAQRQGPAVVDHRSPTSTHANDGKVIAQTPSGGASVNRRDTVVLTVGEYTPPPTTTTTTPTTTHAGP